MRFTNHSERMSHSKARLIPADLWVTLFENELPDYLLPIMQAETDGEIDIELGKILPLLTTSPRKKSAWLAIALSHQDLSNEQLEHTSTSIGISLGDILAMTARYGNLKFLNHLIESQQKLDSSGAVVQSMIAADNYAAFRNAAAGGHLPVMECLIALAPSKVQEMFAADNYAAFTAAACGGHLLVMERLIALTVSNLHSMNTGGCIRDAFTAAACGGHLPVMNYLLTVLGGLGSSEVKTMILVWGSDAFRGAARGGHLPVMERLIELAPAKVQDMIAAENYHAFRGAASGGHLPVMERLIELAPAKVQDMIAYDNYRAFSWAALGGRLPVMECLIALAPSKVQDMIAADNYEAFKRAAAGGHLDVIQFLVQLATDKVQDMIAADNYGAFRRAAAGGHLPVMERLIELARAEVQEMIAAENYHAFREAASGGHLPVMERLMVLAPSKVQEMIAAENYHAFREAVAGGHLPVMERLRELAPAKVQVMIAARDYAAFSWAALGGRLPVMERLMVLAPSKVQEMIAARDYAAFWEAARGGHLPVMERLMVLAPSKVQEMIAAENYCALSNAATRGQISIVTRFLSYPSVFAHAEMHMHEYARHVNRFVAERLIALRAQKNTLEQGGSNAVFDITDANEANLSFYVLRNLIRRNEPALQDDILFLLNIPSVRALAHMEVTPHQPNELLQLALTTNNQNAIGLLLNIPAVHQLAVQNNYYQAEAQGRLDLRALAHSRESSMTALSQGEQRRLERAIACYQPKIQDLGVDNIMTALRETLSSRYGAHSAEFVRQGNPCALPLQWGDFQALGLCPEEKTAAIAAYAAHKDHTAWRYLSKPNPWMHQQAAYVNVNPATREMWSTFEEYQPVICLYYLAAIDEKSPPIDGYTLETRLEGFIDELALIARAHNWDHTRLDDNSIEEEYDDLEGDRPSCFSGVKRRLFQSVKGHPLLIMLTSETITEELRVFVRQHFKDTVNEGNRRNLNDVWNKITEGDDLTTEDLATLHILDMPLAKQDAFITSLGEKYGHQFTAEPAFLLQITAAFALKGTQDAHVRNFGHFRPEDLFKEDAPVVSLSAQGFFTENQGAANYTPPSPDKK